MKLPIMTAEHRAVKNVPRAKSDPVLYSTEANFSLRDEPRDSVRHCLTDCDDTDARVFCVNGETGASSADVCDDESQYVALDCEFVGVGPKLLSALGM